MHTSAHTPGPWQWHGHCLEPAQPDPAQHEIHTILEAENLAYLFFSANLDKARPENDANLALIAAAPQLLDAVRTAAAALAAQAPQDPTTPEAIALAKLRAAIAAAVPVCG